MSRQAAKIPDFNPIEGDLRLSNAGLDRLPGQIRRPGYDRSRVRPGIVHLGIGAFHRAHQAVMIDLHRLSRHRVTAKWWQVKDLAQLMFSSEVEGVTAYDRVRFWRLYRVAKRYPLIAARNSVLVLVFPSLSNNNSIVSTGDSGLSTRRRI